MRRSTLFAPASYVEGWAHYCEQMMVEAGFGRGDHDAEAGPARPKRSCASPASSSGIRLHTDDWSVEQGVRFFRDEAYLEESSARREAERGTFDPTYLVYSAGKLMLLKLRHDWQEEQRRQDLACARSTTRFLGAGSGPVLGAAPPDARRTLPATSWSEPVCRCTNTSATRARIASK